MHRRFGVLVLAGLAVMALPMAAAALGLDVEAKGGAGFALGSTDNKDVAGSPRLAAQGGIGVDLYVLTVGPVDLGLSAGAEYAYLTTHSTWKNFAGYPVQQTTDGRYNYLIFPVSIGARYALTQSVDMTANVGAFIGYFLNGKFDLGWSPEIPPYFQDSKNNKFDSDKVKQMEYGLHVAAGADIRILPNVSVSPALQLDMGLTDITPNNATNGSFDDTLWSLTAMVGIKYKAL